MKYISQIITFPFEESPFDKNAGEIGFIHHKLILSMKFLQHKSRVKNVNIKKCDL